MASQNQIVKAAYWPSWNNASSSSFDTNYFTHIFYAFLLPEPKTYKLKVTEFVKRKLTEFVGGLHTRSPPVKTLLAIGGANNDENVFSTIASSDQNRKIFINSTIKVAREYGFDGLDLDWESPADKQDMANLALLLRDWHESLVIESQNQQRPCLLLTAAVYYSSSFAFYGEPRSYPTEAIGKYLDWVSPMCYDYHGTWSNFTGLHSALYDPTNSTLSTNYGIKSWIEAGVPREKLVMGLAMYGRTWKLQDPKVHRVGAPAIGTGPGDEGAIDYNKIIEFNMGANSIVKFDEERRSYYSYAGDSWIGYDDVPSIKEKVQFARSKGLRGYFFWALGMDKHSIISREASNAWEQ